MDKWKELIFMKKTTLLIILSLCVSVVSANSGPVGWGADPAAQTYTVDKDSQISIEKENLIFDFTDHKYESYNLQGMVSARYLMKNNSDQEKNVLMAFPYLNENIYLGDLSTNSISILVDGKEIGYTYDLNNYRQQGDSDFKNIIFNLDTNKHVPNNFDEEQTLYKYTFEITSSDRMRYKLRFSLDEDEYIFTEGFNSYGRTDNNYVISAHINKSEKITLYVSDRLFSFKEEAVTEDDNAIDDYKVDTLIEEVTMKDYLLSRIESTDENLKDSIYNELITYLDQVLLANDNYFRSDDIYSFFSISNTIITLLYEVEFKPSQVREIVVNYPILGAMNREKTSSEIYKFNYLFNPAENWKSFKDLTVDVYTSDEYPYLVESNHIFSKIEENHYQFKTETLPDKDLEFKLYDQSEVDRKKFRFNPYNLLMIIPIIMLIIFIAVACGFALLLRWLIDLGKNKGV